MHPVLKWVFGRGDKHKHGHDSPLTESISMNTLENLKASIAANKAQIAVAVDFVKQKVQSYETQIKELTAELEASTAQLKEFVDSLNASGGPATP